MEWWSDGVMGGTGMGEMVNIECSMFNGEDLGKLK
jgi:hypothetical protein